MQLLYKEEVSDESGVSITRIKCNKRGTQKLTHFNFNGIFDGAESGASRKVHTMPNLINFSEIHTISHWLNKYSVI